MNNETAINALKTVGGIVLIVGATVISYYGGGLMANGVIGFLEKK